MTDAQYVEMRNDLIPNAEKFALFNTTKAKKCLNFVCCFFHKMDSLAAESGLQIMKFHKCEYFSSYFTIGECHNPNPNSNITVKSTKKNQIRKIRN